MFHRAPENAKTLRPFPAKSLQVAVERTMFAPSCRIFTFSLEKIVYSQEMYRVLSENVTTVIMSFVFELVLKIILEARVEFFFLWYLLCCV